MAIYQIIRMKSEQKKRGERRLVVAGANREEKKNTPQARGANRSGETLFEKRQAEKFAAARCLSE